MLSSGLEDLFLEREFLSNIFLKSQCSFLLDFKGGLAKVWQFMYLVVPLGTVFHGPHVVQRERLWTRQKWTLSLWM